MGQIRRFGVDFPKWHSLQYRWARDEGNGWFIVRSFFITSNANGDPSLWVGIRWWVKMRWLSGPSQDRWLSAEDGELRAHWFFSLFCVFASEPFPWKNWCVNREELGCGCAGTFFFVINKSISRLSHVLLRLGFDMLLVSDLVRQEIPHLLFESPFVRGHAFPLPPSGLDLGALHVHASMLQNNNSYNNNNNKS